MSRRLPGRKSRHATASRIWWCALLVLLALLTLITAPIATSVRAQPATGTSQKLTEALERRGDLTLRNSSLAGALFTISELWGINIVVGAVDGEVNGVFKDAPLREILDSILISNGYSYRAVGEGLVVSRLQDLGQVNPFFESATIPVESAEIEEVVQGAQLMLTPRGQIKALASARSIVVLDFPERVELIRQFVASVDAASIRSRGGVALGAPRNLEVGTLRTQFITAESARLAVEPVLSKEGRIAAVEGEDQVVIVDYSENLEMARRLLEHVDRPRPQVRIRALIYDISLEDIEELGINWNQAIKDRPDANGDAQTALSIDSIMQAPFTAGATGSTLTFMNLSRHLDITGVLLALQNATDARLLADPFVVVHENEDALFQSVSEIPYQQLTETAGGGQIGTTSFKEAGISLRVRPKIAADGTIAMNVMPEFSRLTGFTPGDNQPIIDRRSTTTTLRVANKQLVVIGGLRQRSDVGDFRGVPHLKDWRYLGKLFRARTTNVIESELVVFIMPEIVGYSYPLNPRESLAADTIGCRLDGIPRAEGCPPDCGAVDGAGYEIEGSQGWPVDDSITPIPDSMEEIPAPEPVTGEAVDVSRVSPQARTLVEQGRLKRLPPTIEGTRQATRSHSVAEFENRLRPDYDRRFRATGGVYANQQRVAGREKPATDEPPKEEKPGFWQRMIRF